VVGASLSQVGVLLPATGRLRICPTYSLPGIDTCGLNK